MRFSLRVNGAPREVDVDPETPLLWVLREELDLTGTKYGCGRAQCGACTVHVRGRPVRSCVLPLRSLGERPVITIEGVEGDTATAVKSAWNELQVPQCGFCQSGQVMTAIALLAKRSRPSDDDIDAAMAGNICRCATYTRIRAAIHQAAKGGEA